MKHFLRSYWFTQFTLPLKFANLGLKYWGQTGRYHCEGHLSTITSQMCNIKLQLCVPINELIKKSQVLLLSPIPRYVTTRCCGDKNHLQNFESRSLPREQTAGLEMICDLLQGWGEDRKLNFELLDTPLKVAQVNNGPL
jgi:hypothetical protein